MKHIITPALFAASLGAVMSCAASPDSNGSATLNCDGAMLPSHDVVIEPLFPEQSFELSCGTFSGDLPTPQKIRFRVYEIKKSSLPAPKTDSGGEGGGEGLQEATTTEEEIRIPRSGIAFAPAIQSSLVLSSLKTAPEFQVDASKCTAESKPEDCLISPHEFLGVVTPSTEWCSDTAGIMTYEIWITCNGNSSEFEASVISGQAQPTGAYSFNVTGTTTPGSGLKQP